jgi:hypothetical protein
MSPIFKKEKTHGKGVCKSKLESSLSSPLSPSFSLSSTFELFLLLDPNEEEAIELLPLLLQIVVDASPRSEGEDCCLRNGRGVAEIMDSISGLDDLSSSSTV